MTEMDYSINNISAQIRSALKCIVGGADEVIFRCENFSVVCFRQHDTYDITIHVQEKTKGGDLFEKGDSCGVD